eukprot:16437320-Heterocapsa_arctica.AAC.1
MPHLNPRPTSPGPRRLDGPAERAAHLQVRARRDASGHGAQGPGHPARHPRLPGAGLLGLHAAPPVQQQRLREEQS